MLQYQLLFWARLMAALASTCCCWCNLHDGRTACIHTPILYATVRFIRDFSLSFDALYMAHGPTVVSRTHRLVHVRTHVIDSSCGSVSELTVVRSLTSCFTQEGSLQGQTSTPHGHATQAANHRLAVVMIPIAACTNMRPT